MKRLPIVCCLGLVIFSFSLFSINYVSALNTLNLAEVNVNFNDWNKVGCSESQPFDERQVEFEVYIENTILPENCTPSYSPESDAGIFYYCSKQGIMPNFPGEIGYCLSPSCEYINLGLKLKDNTIYLEGYGFYTTNSENYGNNLFISHRDGSNTYPNGPGVNLCDEPSNDIYDSNGIVEKTVDNNKLILKVAIDTCAYAEGRIGTADFTLGFDDLLDKNNNYEIDFCSTPPSVEVTFNATDVTTDQDFLCIGEISGNDLYDKNLEVSVTLTGGSGTGNPSDVKVCNVEEGENSCKVNVTVPREYTRANDTIVCTMIPFDQEKYGEESSAAIHIKNRAPKVEQVKISAEFDKYAESDWVNYSEVFKKDMKCLINVTDADEEHKELQVQASVEVRHNENDYWHGSWYKIEKSIKCISGQICEIIIPTEEKLRPFRDIFPTDTLVCIINVSDGIEQSVGSSEIKTMPSFDLVVTKLEVLNVIEGTELITNKPIMARAWGKFASNFIDELDIPVTFKLLEGGSKVYFSQPVKIYKDFSREIFIDLIENPALEQFPDVLTSARGNLLKIKRAEDSGNFLDMDELTMPGKYSYSAIIDAEEAVKESKELNNKLLPVVEKRAIEQVRDYNILALIVRSSAEISKPEEVNAMKSMRANVNYLISASPLIKEHTKLTIMVVEIDYDKNKLQNLIGDEKERYAREIRDDLKNKMESMRKKMKQDFVVGVILEKDKNVMYIQGSVADGITPKYTTSSIIKGNADINTLMHEMGHALAGLDDNYDPGFGIPFKEDGWCIDTSGCDADPKINIWTKPDAQWGFTSTDDRPEHDMRLFRNGKNYMGKRYFDIMGNSPNTWTSKKSYDAFIYRLKYPYSITRKAILKEADN